MRTPHAILEVTAQDAESLQINLTAAVEQARDVAMSVGRHVIMVTQHGYNFFTVKLSQMRRADCRGACPRWKPSDRTTSHPVL